MSFLSRVIFFISTIFVVVSMSLSASAQRQIIGEEEEDENGNPIVKPAEAPATAPTANKKKMAPTTTTTAPASPAQSTTPTATTSKKDLSSSTTSVKKEITPNNANESKQDKMDDKKDAVKKNRQQDNKQETKQSSKKSPAKDVSTEKKSDVLDDDVATHVENKAKNDAELAEIKAKEDAEKKKLAKQVKEEARLKDTLASRLEAAKKLRVLTRTSGNYSITVGVDPGEIQPQKLTEVRLSIATKGDDDDKTFRELVPLQKAQLLATVTQRINAQTVLKETYIVHPLKSSGQYGFHWTPQGKGVVSVSLQGKTSTEDSFDANWNMHVGVWPPPDFNDEEKNNAALRSVAAGTRAGIVESVEKPQQP